MKATKENLFGEYLKTLIKQANMTQTQFYTAVGITKPYFYDILSGRVSPPPAELQFKIAQVLHVDSKTCAILFDLAAKGRKEIPADVALWMNNHPNEINNIRKKYENSPLGGTNYE